MNGLVGCGLFLILVPVLVVLVIALIAVIGSIPELF